MPNNFFLLDTHIYCKYNAPDNHFIFEKMSKKPFYATPVVAATMLCLSGCGQSYHDEYATLEECKQDWTEEQCVQLENAGQTTSGGTIAHYSGPTYVYDSPSYGRSQVTGFHGSPSTSAVPRASVIGSPVVRGGFGGTAAAHSASFGGGHGASSGS